MNKLKKFLIIIISYKRFFKKYVFIRNILVIIEFVLTGFYPIQVQKKTKIAVGINYR